MSLRPSTVAVLVAIAAAGASTSASAQATRPHNPLFHANREKYSDKGSKPVSGRSGSAAMESRVLLAKDGRGLIEATTGSLEDGSTAPGSLKKIQLKVFPVSGRSPYTQNFQNASGTGYWSTAYQGLGRNQKVQIQANVEGIDGHRTDVVTVIAQAKRRPDVMVDAVTVPAKAIAGTRMNVVATVSEKNGDVGARATCVLSVDGRASDQASGIWVDAGQTVSCAFQTSIAAVGSHRVGVYVTGVSPVDWDETNNSMSAPVEILSPETPMSYSASFNAEDYDYSMHHKYSSADGSYLDESTDNGTRQNRSMSITAWAASDKFSFPVKVRTSLTSGGASALDFTRNIDASPSESWSGADCGSLFEGGAFILVCNYHMADYTRSQVDVSSYDGRVTYVGTNYYKANGYEGYAYNTSGDYVTGVGAYAVGSEVMSAVELTDARGTVFAARPTISLFATPIVDDWTACYSGGDVSYCWDGKSKGTAKSGTASSITP